jgi:hypothetical protein
MVLNNVEDYLIKCVVDPTTRTFFLYSSEGVEKEVNCDTIEEFMNVLKFVREFLDGRDELVYTNPLI